MELETSFNTHFHILFDISRSLTTNVIVAGCQFAWAIQIGYSTPTLRDLGLSSALVSYVWLAAPLTGLIVHPVIGYWSDHCNSRFGRRKPFLFVGTMMSMFALIVFSNSKVLGLMLGDSEDRHTFGLVIAILGFWMLDLSINVSQAPIRALISDVVPESLQEKANAAVAINNGVGKGLGYLCGGLDFVGLTGGFFASNVQAVYSIGVIYIGVSAFTTLNYAPNSPRDGLPGFNTTLLSIFQDLGVQFSRMPVAVYRAFTVQFFNFFSWYLVYIYLTDWFGEVLLHGNAHANEDSSAYLDYQKGILEGNLALFCMALTSMVCSIALPVLMRVVPLKVLWGSIQLVFFLGTILLIFVKTAAMATAVIVCCFSMHLASVYVIPWWIVTRAVSAIEGRGFQTALFNLCQGLPNLLVTLLANPYLRIMDHNLTTVFGLAAIGPLCAVVAIQFVIVPEKSPGSPAEQRPLLGDSHG